MAFVTLYIVFLTLVIRIMRRYKTIIYYILSLYNGNGFLRCHYQLTKPLLFTAIYFFFMLSNNFLLLFAKDYRISITALIYQDIAGNN